MPPKDNTRKVVTFILVSVGVLLLSYVAIRIPEARNEALVAVSSLVTMALVFYFGVKPRS